MAEQKKRRGRNVKVVKPEDPIPFGMEITDVKNKKWIFGNELGSGGCGVVYEGSNGLSSSFDFVIKIEYHANGSLYSEIHVYHAIGKQESINQFVKRKRLNFLGIPVCHGTGSFDYNGKKYRFLVLQRYGKDLQHVLNENNNTLHPKTVFTVGNIVINALEYIHSLGYVHQDIKAANLMVGRVQGTANHVFLLDMGLATRYISKENVHKSDKPNPGRSNNGTPEFLSRDGHVGVFSRRSDLEILGYNMLLWLSGTLPWINITDPVKLKDEKIRYMNDVPQLMKCLFPSSSYPELQEFLTYVSRLGFEETPHYDSYVTMFKHALDRLQLKNDGILILKEPNKGMDRKSDHGDNETYEGYYMESTDEESDPYESAKEKNTPGKSAKESIQDTSIYSKRRNEKTYAASSFVDSAEMSKTANAKVFDELSGIHGHLFRAQQLHCQHSSQCGTQLCGSSRGRECDKRSLQNELIQIKREKLRSLQNIELSLHSIDLTLRKILELYEKSQKPKKDTSLASDSVSSQKENNVKKGERKKRVNRDASTSSSSAVLASGEVLTPAMLDVINRQQQRAAEKASKKPRKKVE